MASKESNVKRRGEKRVETKKAWIPTFAGMTGEAGNDKEGAGK
jgi:hypothetical protein